MVSTPLLDKEIETTRQKKEVALKNLQEVNSGRGSGTGQAAEDKYSFYDNALARLEEAKTMSDKYTEESLIGWAYDKAQAREERKEYRRDLPEKATWQDVPAQKVSGFKSVSYSEKQPGKIQPSQPKVTGSPFLLKPGEETTYGSMGVPYWTIQSKTFEEGIGEGQFIASNVDVKKPLFSTSDYFLSEQAKIETARNIYSQTELIRKDFMKQPESYVGQAGVTQDTTSGMITLTPEYFEKNIDITGASTTGIIKAREQYGLIDERKRFRMEGLGLAVGGAKAVVGGAEFTGKIFAQLGSAYYKEGELIRPTFNIETLPIVGGVAGDIKYAPTAPTTTSFLSSPGTYIKEKLTYSPQTVGSGIVMGGAITLGGMQLSQNIKTYGAKEGILETASYLSPVRLASKTYFYKPSSELVSFKQTSGDITSRAYAGIDYVKSGGKMGVVGGETIIGGQAKGFQIVGTPSFTIRGGGTIIKPGYTTQVIPYAYSEIGTGKGYGVKGGETIYKTYVGEYPGGVAKVTVSGGVRYDTIGGKTTVTTNLLKETTYNIGSVMKETSPISERFITGKANAVSKTTIAPEYVGFGKTGRYRFKVGTGVRGVEYDLGKIGDYYSKPQGFTISGQPKGNLGNGRTIAQQVIKTSSFNVPGYTAPTRLATTQPQGLIIATPKLETINKQSFSIKQVGVQTPQLVTPVTKQKYTPQYQQTYTPGMQTITTPKYITQQYTPQIQTTVQYTPQQYKPPYSPIVTPIIIQPGITTPITPPPFVFGFPSFDFGTGGYAKKGGKKYVKYTPSFSALLFNIRGKAAKKGKRGYTGIEFRAIPKGFKFDTGLSGGLKFKL